MTAFWLLTETAFAAPAPSPTPAVADLTRPPSYQSVRISPSGDLLAATVRKGGFEGVAVLKRKNLEPVTAHKFGDDTEIFGLEWVTDELLLISPGIRIPGRTDFVFPTGEILAFNLKTQRAVLIYGYRAGQQQTGSHLKRRESKKAAATLVNVLPNQPNHVLIQTRPFGSRGGLTQLQRMDVRTGKLRVIGRSEDLRSRFVTDSHGKLLLRARYDVSNDLHVERKLKNGYETLFSSSSREGYVIPGPAAGSTNQSASGERGFYAFADQATGTSAVLLFKLDGSSTVVHRKTNLEPDQFLTNRANNLWGVRFDGSFPDYFYPDPQQAVAHMHKRLLETFSGQDVEFTSFSEDERFAIALVRSDTNPGRYYVIDLKASSVVELLDTRPWLSSEQLSPMQPVEIKVRDGQKIVAMLTVPKVGLDKSAAEISRPAVVLVHGGPHGVFDRWGFNSTVQLLASRGYVVLQVNYRGSGGYGRAFESAGYGEWGGLMQQDVADATRWLAKSGIVDASKICIMGGSYGAYSAMTGAFQEPKLYRCAIGYAGVYDLPLMFEKGDIQRRSSGANYLRDTLGENNDELRKRSPVFNADKIEAKVFLAHGGLDIRTPPAHARRLRKRLVQAGNEPRWMFFDKEGHGFQGAENRLKFYTEVLDFLNEHTR